jgi:hypothetical protein
MNGPDGNGTPFKCPMSGRETGDSSGPGLDKFGVPNYDVSGKHNSVSGIGRWIRKRSAPCDDATPNPI